eukprot:3901902-Amphidinium_carterae.1
MCLIAITSFVCQIPSDALAQTVDTSTFPTFGEWKKTLHVVPAIVARDAEVMTSYRPLGNNIIGFETPVNLMSDLKPPSKNQVFIPISWNAECVQLPYEDFYLDGCRLPPFNKGFTGYEGLSMDYKGPMVEE